MHTWCSWDSNPGQQDGRGQINVLSYGDTPLVANNSWIKIDEIVFITLFREVVVAQLVEQLLPVPEVRGLNPVISKKIFISNICLLSAVYWKDENIEKEAGNGPFFYIVQTQKLKQWGMSLWQNGTRYR